MILMPGYVDYSVKFLTVKEQQSLSNKLNVVSVRLEDKLGNVAGSATGESGRLTVSGAKLWWPFTMVANESDAGYLYTLVVYSQFLDETE
jgi:hypothetical protein